MSKQYIQLYYSYLEAIEPLSDAERGRVFTSLLIYGKTGIAPELSGNERFIFPMMRAQTDRDNEAYENKCRKNSENRQSVRTSDNGNDERQRTSTNTTKEKEKEKEKKEKESNPILPLDAAKEDVFKGYSFSTAVQASIMDWLNYKKERRQAYKQTGIKSLFTQIENKLKKYNELQVIFAITESMACNYQGIIWDKIKEFGQGQASTAQKRNKFANFEGRDRNYAELEKMELNYLINSLE